MEKIMCVLVTVHAWEKRGAERRDQRDEIASVTEFKFASKRVRHPVRDYPALRGVQLKIAACLRDDVIKWKLSAH